MATTSTPTGKFKKLAPVNSFSKMDIVKYLISFLQLIILVHVEPKWVVLLSSVITSCIGIILNHEQRFDRFEDHRDS
jgi:hypothetical protein